MKMKIEVCDLCKKNSPDVKIKYKAKRFWWSWYEGGWEKIELCQECLDKIIKAKEGEFDQEEVLDKVKWELEEAQRWSFITHSEYEGLRLAINIIDKHRDEHNKEGKKKVE